MKYYALNSPQILAFTSAAFALGLSEFVVIGLVSQIAETRELEMSSSSLLVAFYALGISIGAPVVTALTQRISGRVLCISLIWLFATANLMSAVLPSFAGLLIARCLAGVLHGCFFSISSAHVTEMVEPKTAPAAIAVMFSGLTLAMVLGVPFGMWLGSTAGWQAPFILIAVLSALSGVWLQSVTDRRFGAPSASVSAEGLLKVPLLKLYGVTVLAFGGGFVFFPLIEPYLAEVGDLSFGQIAFAMGLIGVGSLAGNILGGLLPTKMGLNQALSIMASLQALALVGVWSVAGNTTVVLVMLIVWSATAFSIPPMVQTAAVQMGGAGNGRVSAALNATAFNIGIAGASYFGALIGGVGGLSVLPICAALVVILAVPLCLRRNGAGRPKLLTGPHSGLRAEISN
ncbi:MAG: MFS transporter [Paracoccaceae bacterium]